MKKYKKPILGVLALVLILSMMPFIGSVSGAVEITKYPQYKTGDYFKYDLKADGIINSIKGQFEGNATVQIEGLSAEMKITGTETIAVNGTTYECILSEMTMDIKFHISGQYALGNYTADVHTTIVEKAWMRNSDTAEVKTISLQNMYMNMTMMGQHVSSDSKMTTETTYDPPVAEYKLPVKVGDRWETQTTERVHTIQMTRMNGGEWQKTETTHTESAMKKYEVISEETITVKAGTFDTLKIKAPTPSHNESEYTCMYITSDGLPVKMESISSDGKMMVSMDLKEYKYANASSGSSTPPSSGGIPGFEAVLAITAISMAGIAYGYRRRH